jgi:hypothetical protein
MANGEVPEKEDLSTVSGSTRPGILSLLTVAALAVLAAGEIFTLYRTASLRDALEAQTRMRSELRAELQEQINGRLTAIETADTQRIDELQSELDDAAKRMGTTGGELKHARAMVAKLHEEHQQETEQIKKELAQKADQQQVGALNQDITAQRTDIDSTKKALDSVRSDLGMARSEMGTLIARNHDEIDQLRKLGERDYLEFTVDRKKPAHVAGVNLGLKRTNVKRHRFTLEMTVDDLQVEKKDRTINEPIFFYVNGSRKPYELVVNEVKSDQVKGYLSTPKGAAEIAARSEGTH